METTIEQLITKYNNHKHSIEQNTKLINDYNMDLEEIEKAIEIIEKNERLLDQIQEYDKKLEGLASDYQLRNEDSINVFEMISNRKQIEDERDFLVNLKELLEKNNVKDLNSKDEILKVLNKYKNEMKSEVETCETNINNSMLIIKNIDAIYKERLNEFEEKNTDRTQKIQFAENEIKPLIEQMKQTEIELKKYELFKNEGVLTHVQTLEINRLTNVAKEITKDFLEKLNQNPLLAEIINSTDMINKYYSPYVSQLSSKEQDIEYNMQTTQLKKLISEVEKYLENDNQEQNIVEEKKEFNSDIKSDLEQKESNKTEANKKKYPIYEEPEVPYVSAEIVPEDEYKGNQNKEKIIDVEPVELKPIDEVSNEKKDSFEPLAEEKNNNEQSINMSNEFLKYLGNLDKEDEKETTAEQENKVEQNEKQTQENNSIDMLKDDINKNETFNKEQPSEEKNIQNNQSVNKSNDFLKHLDKDSKNEIPIQPAVMTNPENELNEIINNVIERKIGTMEIEKPKKSNFLSKIIRKIKRRKSSVEHAKDIRDSIAELSKEIKKNDLSNNNIHRR